MQVFRTVIWIVVTAILVAFIAMNWTRVPVNFWPLQGNDYLHFEWPVGIVALAFFLLGAIPMWLLLRTARWRLNRRISALENSVRATAVAVPPSTFAADAADDLSTENPTP